MNEFGRRYGVLANKVGPELPREVELGVDVQGARNVDRTVAALRRVVELAEGGVTGPGVVPGVRTLFGRALKGFEHGDIEVRLYFLQQRGEGCAHDPGPDQDDI